jgi:hypothetical protein
MADTNETPPPRPRDLKALIETERLGSPFIYWHNATGEQQIMVLREDHARVTVGRREQSDVPLSWDSEVSRAHALLEPVGGEWTLVDDGLSRNGSWVNGGRVRGRQRLHDRDRMCFGNTPVFYREPAGAAGSTSTARAPGSPSSVLVSETQRRVLIALCRPIVVANAAIPATNPQIATEVYLSVDAVKAHLRVLFERFQLGELPQNEKRSRLVAIVMESGLLTQHDF